MTTYIIKIVLDNKLINTVRVDAKSQSHAEDIAFDWCDSLLGIEVAKDVELFFINHLRHQVLFKGL